MAQADTFAKRFSGSQCLIDNDQQRGDRGSRDPELVSNPDGSVDLYFTPAEPASGPSNWVQMIPGRHWFSYFRLYGPLEPYFDRSWKLATSPRHRELPA
jgi:hypothetical protein